MAGVQRGRRATQRPRRTERGAAFVATVLMMSVILLIGSLVIDIGGDRVVRREMQAMADVLALDVVRRLDGSPAANYSGYDATAPSATLLAAAKTESLNRQSGALARPDTVTIRLAVTDKDSGDFVRWAGPTDIPNAVRVWTTGGSAFRFLPTTPRDSSVQRSALAVIGPAIACISAGATFADVSPQGPLDTMLGKLVGVDRLTVLDPYALASLDLEIPLIDLAGKLGVGTVDDIMTANVSAQGFVLAISEVLPHKGNSASIALLDAIANGLPNTGTMDISKILTIDTGGGSGTGLSINTFSLIQSTIMLANKENFVNIGTVISVPGLSKVTVTAKVVEAPQNACGPIGTTARSAQLQVRVAAEVKSLGSLDVVSAEIDPLFVTVAEGSGRITEINCSAGDRSVSVLANTAVGKVGVRLLTKVKVAGGLLGGLLTVPLEVGAPDPGVKPAGADIGSTSSQTLDFDFPGTDLPAGKTAGTVFGNLGLSSITPIKLTADGIALGPLLGSVVVPLLGIIDPLVSTLLKPILASLGVSVGTVRIQPTSVPSCNEPLLRD